MNASAAILTARDAELHDRARRLALVPSAATHTRPSTSFGWSRAARASTGPTSPPRRRRGVQRYRPRPPSRNRLLAPVGMPLANAGARPLEECNRAASSATQAAVTIAIQVIAGRASPSSRAPRPYIRSSSRSTAVAATQIRSRAPFGTPSFPFSSPLSPARRYRAALVLPSIPSSGARAPPYTDSSNSRPAERVYFDANIRWIRVVTPLLLGAIVSRRADRLCPRLRLSVLSRLRAALVDTRRHSAWSRLTVEPTHLRRRATYQSIRIHVDLRRKSPEHAMFSLWLHVSRAEPPSGPCAKLELDRPCNLRLTRAARPASRTTGLVACRRAWCPRASSSRSRAGGHPDRARISCTGTSPDARGAPLDRRSRINRCNAALLGDPRVIFPLYSRIALPATGFRSLDHQPLPCSAPCLSGALSRSEPPITSP